MQKNGQEESYSEMRGLKRIWGQTHPGLIFQVKMVRLEKIGFLWPGLDILLTRRVGDASSPLPMFCRYLLAADLRFPSLFESKG